MPTLRPASITLVPGSTSTVRSLMVILGTSLRSALDAFLEKIPLAREGAGAVADVPLDLVGKTLDQGLDRTDRRVAQGAQRLAADVLADGEQELRVALAPLAVLEALEHQLHPVRPLPAGRALAARLVVEELRE